MSALNVFGGPSWRFLVVALLHTLWQGASIALLLAFALRRLRAGRPEMRYLLALGAQSCVLVAGLATWSWLALPEPHAPPVDGVGFETANPSEGSSSVVEATVSRDENRQTTPPAPESRWISVLAIGWLAGVGLMLIKSAGSVVSAHRLTRGPDLEEPTIVAMLDRLRDGMRIHRPIRLVVCEAIAAPAVLGLIRPTLILPISLLTGLPPYAVRAILAHELAHIRRYDYVANLGQMLIESLLFFNPMVWWLGRQVRIEREACCDALAVRVLGDPLAYSRALADWAGSMSPQVVVASWSGDGRPSTLLERIHRVLRPGDRFGPQRISLASLLVLLTVGPILLALLWKGSQTAAVLAAQALTPAQRIEKIVKARELHEGPRDSGRKTVLKGTFLTSDGKPFESPVSLWMSWRDGGGGHSGWVGNFYGGRFSFEAPSVGTALLVADPEIYAAKVVGTFELAESKPIGDIAIVLDPGFAYQLRLIDEEDMPIVGASIQLGPHYNSRGEWKGRIARETDPNGIVTWDHVTAQPYGLSIKAPGYQSPLTNPMMRPNPGGSMTLRLPRFRATRGTVVDRSGRPVADAKIRILATKSADLDRVRSYGLTGPQVGRTNVRGEFRIDSLRDGEQHLLLVDSPAKERGLVPNVRSGQVGLRATLEPCPALLGEIKEDLKTLDLEIGVPIVSARQVVATEFGLIEVTHQRVSVDENGRFRLDNLVPGQVTLRAGSRIIRFSTSEAKSQPALVPDLAPADPDLRQVVLQVVSGAGPIDSSRSLLPRMSISRGAGPSSFQESVVIREGRAIFKSPVGSEVRYAIDGDLTGYWFPPGSLVVGPGAGDQTLEIKAVPAGAIMGRLIESDGKPCAGVYPAWKVLDSPKLRGLPEGLQYPGVAGNGFYISPLPLGVTYVVYALRGGALVPTEPIQLDEANPTRTIEIRVPPEAHATGRVVGPDGRPVPRPPVSIVYDFPEGGGPYGWMGSGSRDDGTFFFSSLMSGKDYSVFLDFRADYIPAKVPLKIDGSAVEIHVERGKRLEGRVLDASTGRAIPGVELFATTDDPASPKELRRFKSEAVTDDDGRFRFSNLPDRIVRLNDSDGLNWESPTSRLVQPDKSPPILIRATLPSLSQLKPAPRKE